MLIYNLFPPLAGKFTAWEPHIRRAAGMGFDWVFVNPIQYPGFSGSLYSIKDYGDFNPLFVDETSALSPGEQVCAATALAASLGMGVIVDLVINHTAVDSALVKTHPSWYCWEQDGNICHPFAHEDGHKVLWGDLAKLNHTGSPDREGMYQYFLGVVRRMIALGFRGFRCDAAYQVPRELWRRLITDVKAERPDVVFLAETLGCTPDQTNETARAGFDYVFNSSKWWDFGSPWLMEQYNLTRSTTPSISFPESHDTVRLCEELNCNVAGMKQRYLFSALFSAGVMMPMGFEYGFRKRPHVVKSRPEDWEKTAIDLTAFIKEVNAMKAANTVFLRESETDIYLADNHAIMVMWKYDPGSGEKAALILNKDIHNQQRLRTENVRELIRTATRSVVDISPDRRMESVPDRLHYTMEPGQGIVLKAVK